MGAHSQQQQLHSLKSKLIALESTQRETDEEHARILVKQKEQTDELQTQNARMRLLLGLDKQVNPCSTIPFSIDGYTHQDTSHYTTHTVDVR